VLCTSYLTQDSDNRAECSHNPIELHPILHNTNMRIANICIALFASISATFSAASEFDAVIQPSEFRVLRGTKKHSAKRNKSHSKKGGNKLLSIPTSGDNKANSNVADVSSCPEEKPDTDTLCSIEGQHCIFTFDTTFPGGSSTAMDECTCTTGKWVCEATMASSGIATNGCPAESPLVTKDKICDTPHRAVSSTPPPSLVPFAPTWMTASAMAESGLAILPPLVSPPTLRTTLIVALKTLPSVWMPMYLVTKKPSSVPTQRTPSFLEEAQMPEKSAPARVGNGSVKALLRLD
jgi:hypothetical protein